MSAKYFQLAWRLTIQSSYRAQTGFTLIELLIVIVLIGIISTLTTLSIHSADLRDQQHLEGEKLLQLMQLAVQEAMIQGMPIGLQCYRQGYRLLSMNHDHWQTNNKDRFFQTQSIHPALTISLRTADQALVLPDQVSAYPQPQIVFDPEGNVTPFQLLIVAQDSQDTVTVTYDFEQGLTMTR